MKNFEQQCGTASLCCHLRCPGQSPRLHHPYTNIGASSISRLMAIEAGGLLSHSRKYCIDGNKSFEFTKTSNSQAHYCSLLLRTRELSTWRVSSTC